MREETKGRYQVLLRLEDGVSLTKRPVGRVVTIVSTYRVQLDEPEA
jgi:hypothetical protein